MQYHLLTERALGQISEQRLLELEAEYARLALDLRIAGASGVDNDNTLVAHQQLELLGRQIAMLASWIKPAPDGDVLQAEVLPASGDNGQAVAAR